MKKILSLAIMLTLFAAVFAKGGAAKYVFFFIGDGMGMNQVNGTEMYLAQKEGVVGNQSLLFTQFPYTGFAKTYSTDNSITDSAAGGTALAVGEKTKNGTIGMDRTHTKNLESVAVKAKKAGRQVGIMTTVSVDHATPSSFYAHTPSRSMYYEIGTFIPKSGFDFFAGSGLLSPNKKDDEKAPNLFDLINSAGYEVAHGMKEYAEISDKAGKVILLQEKGKSAYSLPYAIDRNEDDLTLAQITKSALEFLTKKDEGFFMMIEGGMIDWAAHSNDGATVFEEVKDMDDAVKIAYDFYLQHPDSTLIVITADHETGGLGLGVEGYTLNLDNFQYQKLSQSGLSKAIQKLRDEKKSNLTWDDLKTLISDKTGLWNKIDVTKHQEKEIRHEFDNMMSKAKADTKKTEYSEDSAIAALVVKIMNRDAKVGWTSNTHTAALVPVFAIGAGAEEFVGLMENTDVPKRIQKAGGY